MKTRLFFVATCGAIAVVCGSQALAADGDRLFTVRGGVYVPQKPGSILPEGFGEPVLEEVPGITGKQWVARLSTAGSATTAPASRAAVVPAAPPAPTKASAPPAPDPGTALIQTVFTAKPLSEPQAANSPGGGDSGPAKAGASADLEKPATSQQVQDLTTKVDKLQTTVQAQQKPPQGFCGLLGFSCGVGLTYAHTFGSERVDSVSAIQQAGTSQLYLQAKTSQNDNVAILGELHHFFLWDRMSGDPNAKYPDQNGVTYSSVADPRYVRADLTKFRLTPLKKGAYVNGRNLSENESWPSLIPHDVGAVLACGPFAFWPAFDAGCGPVAVAAVSTDGKSVTQFGVGWAGGVSTIGGADGTGFNFGIGVLFDPGEQILDSRIVNPNSRVVLPAYDSTVLANPSSALVKRPTHSIFIMVSKTVG